MSEYVMSRERAEASLNDYAGALADVLLTVYSDGVDAGAEQFVTWAEEAERGAPENRWAALQACSAFARGMLVDAGDDPAEVAASIAEEQQPATPGILDALAILGSDGEPDAELADEWLDYASGTLPQSQYVELLTFLFFLGVAAAPAAATNLNSA